VTAFGKLIRTTAFRLTLVYLFLFALFAASLLGYFAWNTRRLITEQITSTVNAEASEILLITPQIEQTVVELRQLLEEQHSIDIDCSNPIKVQGENRRLVHRLRYYWLDPFSTMIRLTPRVWRYRLVITYYHRNGYWLGVLGRLFRRDSTSRWVWIGFAPNPPRSGLLGWIKECITYNALLGHDLGSDDAR